MNEWDEALRDLLIVAILTILTPFLAILGIFVFPIIADKHIAKVLGKDIK